jgi:hypothetical protein
MIPAGVASIPDLEFIASARRGDAVAGMLARRSGRMLQPRHG